LGISLVAMMEGFGNILCLPSRLVRHKLYLGMYEKDGTFLFLIFAVVKVKKL